MTDSAIPAETREPDAAAMAAATSSLLGDVALPIATAALLLLALLFGGGTQQGIPSDAVVELASLPVLVIAIAKLSSTGIPRAAFWPLVIGAAALALPLLQLVPLPTWIWTHLPLRQIMAQVYDTAGLSLPAMPLSMNPGGTWRSFASLLPAATIFLATLSLGGGARRTLLALMIVVGLFSVGLDLLQTIGGSDSPLRFYEITNTNRAVGFFANSNHNAAALYCLVPFVAALTIDAIRFRGWRTRAAFTLMLLFLVLDAVGLVLALSRAGLFLWFLAGALSVGLGWTYVQRSMRRRIVLLAVGAALVVLLAMFQFGFVGMMQRMSDNVPGQFRWKLTSITLSEAAKAFPWGTGLASFVPIFQTAEPRTLIDQRYVNHAHNDWAELLLETGLPGVLLLAAFLWWLVSAVRRQAVADGAALSSRDQPIAFAAAIAISLLLLHSLVDYPLRTIAIMAYFAFSCALLLPPAPADEPPGGERPATRPVAARTQAGSTASGS